jgi:hypothetical protein
MSLFAYKASVPASMFTDSINSSSAMSLHGKGHVAPLVPQTRQACLQAC